jgi:hypothetical protein
MGEGKIMGKKSSVSAEISKLIGGGKGKKKQKGKKNRKIGRYAKHPSSMRYKGERRWLRNKVRRMTRHLKRHPGDRQAQALLPAAREAA